MSHELDAYRRLQDLAASRLRGIPDPALDKILRRTRDAHIRELLRCVERLPTAADRKLALAQAAQRASEVEYLRACIVELGNTLQ